MSQMLAYLKIIYSPFKEVMGVEAWGYSLELVAPGALHQECGLMSGGERHVQRYLGLSLEVRGEHCRQEVQMSTGSCIY